MTEKCKNCFHFDGSQHEKDARTKHAGICKNFNEIVFKNETCKFHFTTDNLPLKNVFSEPQIAIQLNLFN